MSFLGKLADDIRGGGDPIAEGLEHLALGTVKQIGSDVAKTAVAGLHAAFSGVGDDEEPQHDYSQDLLPMARTSLLAAGPEFKAAEEGIATRLGGGLGARVAGRAAVGAPIGALYNPQKPFTGALAGAAGSVAIGGMFGQGAPAAVTSATDAAAAPQAGVSLETMIQNLHDNADKLAAKPEGFTFDPRTGEIMKNGNFVGLGKQPGVFAHADDNPLPSFDGEAGEQILRNNADLFQNNPDVKLGGWGTDNGMHVEPSQHYASPDEAFNAAVEGKQMAMGNLTNGEYTEVPTAGPDALDVYNLAKQNGVNPSDVSRLKYALGLPENSVAETLAQLGAAAQAGADPAAVGGVAGGAGTNQGGASRFLPSVGGEQPAFGGAGGGNVPPEEGAGAAGESQGPPRLEPGDAQTGPGSPDGQRAFDERIPEDQLDVNDWINASKFSMGDPDANDILASLTRRTIQNHGLNPKQVVSHAETIAAAKDLGVDPATIAGVEGVMTRPQLTASRFAMRRLSLGLSGLGQRYRELKAQGLDGQAEEIFGHMTNLVDQFDAVASRFITGRSEAGRTLDALKIAASQTTDPTVWMIRAKQKLGEAPLTPEMQSQIEQYAGKAADAPMGSFQRNKNLALLAKFTDSLGPTDRWYNAGSAYRAGLLSSPSSLVGAMTGHATWAIWHGGEQNITAALDQLMGKATGVNTLGFNIMDDLRARAAGVKAAMPKVGSLLRYGVTGDEVGRVAEMPREMTLTTPQERFEMDDILHKSGDVGLTIAGKRVAETYVNVVRRLYGVVPTIIREQAEGAARAARARGIAISENLGGALLDQRVQDLIANPSPEMLEYSKGQGESAALTAQTALGDLLNSVTGKIDQYPGGKLATAVFAPFKMVPSNIATIPAKRMPWMVALGMKDFAVAATKRNMTQEARAALQLQAADRITRGGSGAALLGTGMWLAKHGLMTPPSSGNKTINQTRMLLGQQPNSFLVGGSYVSGARLQPLTTMIGLGALIHGAFTDPTGGDFESRLAGIVKGYTGMLADAPFFEGMQNVTRALEQPGSFASKFSEDVVKGVVPSIVRHTAQAIDPNVHTIPDSGFGKYVATVESVLPGLSQRLPVAEDQLGHPITRQGGVGAFSPFPAMPNKAATDPVSAAIAATGAHVPALAQGPGESVADFQQRQDMAGRMLNLALGKLITSPSYQNVDATVARLQQNPAFRDAKPDDLSQALERMMIEKVVARVHSVVNRGFAEKEGHVGPRQLRAFMTPPNADDNQQ